MTVWQRIARFAALGGMLGSLTACTMVGWWQFTGGGSNVKSSGYARTVESALTAFFMPDGTLMSQHGSVKFDGSAAGAVSRVQARRLFHAGSGECFWDEVACSGIGIASAEGRLAAETPDTNGDGYISGAADFQPAGGDCGITDAATASTGSGMPFGAIWLDTPVCPSPIPPGTFTSGLTEASINQAWGGTFTNQDPAGTNALLHQLPFETVQDIINSVDASDVRTEIVGGSPMQVVKLQVTNVRIGGASYRPVGVYLNLYNWAAMKFDMNKEPGLKLLAAWAANKTEELLERGATNIRWAIELNGSVTLTKDSLPKNMVITDLNQSTVASWRHTATTNLRTE